MALQTDSPAVAVARAHVEAWSNHDFDTARRSLASGVRVTVTTTKPLMPAVDTTGIEEYMLGLKAFAQAVEPGTARVIASLGDEHNALLLVSVEANLGGGRTALPGARLYLIDDTGKINIEQVVFMIPD
jgi:hypothetical protein